MLESEQIVKGYDPVIMRRLLGFLRPYRATVAVAVVALLCATAGELLLPVIIQQTLDRYILSAHRRIPEETVAEAAELGLELSPGDPVIGEYRYVPDERLSSVAGADMNRLREQGIVSAGEYLLVRLDPTDQEQAAVLRNHPGLFTSENGWAAVSRQELSSLSPDELRILRKDDFAGVMRAAIFFLLALLGVMLFSFIQVYLMAKAGQEVMQDIRIRLFDHTIRQNLSFLNRNPVGKLVTRVTNDVETINELFTSVVTSLLKDGSLMIGVIVTLFLLSVPLGFVAVLTLPPVAILTLVFRHRAREAFRRVRLWVSRVNAFLSEHLSGVAVVQMFVQQERSRREFREQNEELLRAKLGEMFVFATFRPMIDLLSSISIGAVVFFGAGFYLRDIVSLGILIAFLDLIRRFYQPVMDIAEKYTILQSAMAGGERVFGLLDEEERIPDRGQRTLPAPVQGEIVFDRVDFSYKQGEPVLRDLSFRVAPGETVALVGYTGAGKTTIANLLARLWDIDSGSIRIDGVDIRDLSLAQLRRTVQPVQQDVFLFTGTVEENIALGSPIPAKTVHTAARLVQAEPFIDRLPDRYASRISEGGSNISSGQRQLIAFARAVAHDAAIIILDEATGNIDTETEKLIQKGMDELLRNRTSLVIAHRLSTIQHADRILVLSGGRLAEEGNHEELLTRRGIYYNLYKLQYEKRL